MHIKLINVNIAKSYEKDLQNMETSTIRTFFLEK